MFNLISRYQNITFLLAFFCVLCIIQIDKSPDLCFFQLEDQAMEDLLSFYNASNVFDERITVQRVITTNIARPTWITNRRH